MGIIPDTAPGGNVLDADAQQAKQLAQARQKGRMLAENASIKTQEFLDRLDPAHRPKVAKRLAQMPAKCRPAYLRAMSGKSKSAAIRAFCQECVGWEGLPDSVRTCTAPACCGTGGLAAVWADQKARCLALNAAARSSHCFLSAGRT